MPPKPHIALPPYTAVEWAVIYGVYLPVAVGAFSVLAVVIVVCAPVDWAVRHIWAADDPHPLNRWWTGW